MDSDIITQLNPGAYVYDPEKNTPSNDSIGIVIGSATVTASEFNIVDGGDKVQDITVEDMNTDCEPDDPVTVVLYPSTLLSRDDFTMDNMDPSMSPGEFGDAMVECITENYYPDCGEFVDGDFDNSNPEIRVYAYPTKRLNEVQNEEVRKRDYVKYLLSDEYERI